MTAAPKVDSRDAARVAAELTGLLRQSLPNWTGPAVDTATRAMIHVFARYCEIIIDRLNRAPDKNLLAFLDLLGAEPLPPQPARAPVTFYLTASRQADVMVPRRTQIAAPPPPGGQEPIVFETEHELTVTSARLDSLFVKDGSADRYADLRMTLGVAEGPAAPIFEGNQPIEHAFLIGLGTAVAQPVNQLRIRFDLGAPAAQLLRCAWEWRGEKDWIVLTPESDGTKGLTQSGEVVFRNLPAIPETLIEGTREHYLRCRLMDPLTGAMPKINRLAVTVDLEKDGIPLDKAFFNAAPVDISKDFYPFGENPRFGDVFFFSSAPAFSPPGARVTLHVRMTNPASAGETSPVLPVGPRNTRLAWEYWDGNTWAELGVAEFGRPASAAPASFSDTTDTFSQDGEVTFQFGSPGRATIVNGQPGLWVRVRLIGGDYGRDVSYEADTARGYVVVPSTLRPPVIHSIVCEY